MARLTKRERKLMKILDRHNWKIADKEYRVAWCESIEGKDTVGYCDDEAKIIYLKTGEPIEETFKAIIHEIIHSFQCDYKIKLTHKDVYKLERAIFETLAQNEII